MKILNYGSLNIDNVYQVPHIVRPGETISSQSFLTFAGGKGANQFVAIARAGRVTGKIPCACLRGGGRLRNAPGRHELHSFYQRSRRFTRLKKI